MLVCPSWINPFSPSILFKTLWFYSPALLRKSHTFQYKNHWGHSHHRVRAGAFTLAFWTRLKSEIWCHHHSKRVIYLKLWIHTPGAATEKYGNMENVKAWFHMSGVEVDNTTKCWNAMLRIWICSLMLADHSCVPDGGWHTVECTLHSALLHSPTEHGSYLPRDGQV